MGIEAENEEKALEKAANAFDEGTIWDDTPEMPLLYDEFEEIKGGYLEFNIESAVEAFPKPDASVIQMKQDNQARTACRMLVEAFEQSKIDVDDMPSSLSEALIDVYAIACQAIGAKG
ncbi:hypothetical protein Thpro_022053 [Acidihalobacter prosperus]|uniref:Uncharacterized protein n=1 Tax=Acidihalobacter prosperus TaxID=160660 RepID=A0A1A6C302_9GAMM|nr:hypothetical protein Thpro_022053 [Acidihalobacter prosperus]